MLDRRKGAFSLAKSKHTAEQIVEKLRQAEVVLAQGQREFYRIMRSQGKQQPSHEAVTLRPGADRLRSPAVGSQGGANTI